MKKKERDSIDQIVSELRGGIEYIEGYNVSVSRFSRLCRNSNDLSKEQDEALEAICKQIEESLQDIGKTTDWLACFGSVVPEYNES